MIISLLILLSPRRGQSLEAEAEARTFEAEARTLEAEAEAEARTLEARAEAKAEFTQFCPSELSKFRRLFFKMSSKFECGQIFNVK